MYRQTYPSYAKIRFMRSEMEGFRTIISDILSETCKDPTYARFTVGIERWSGGVERCMDVEISVYRYEE